MQSKCLTLQVNYEVEATNSTDEEIKIYYDLTETTFKERYRKHKTSFNYRDCMKDTELSKYIWSVEDQNKVPQTKWGIVKKVNSRAKLSYCKLCLFEKLFLIKSLGEQTILNTKS